MNLILFEAPFEQFKLSAKDPRTRHILTVLKIKVGGLFYIGFVNSERALVKIESINEEGSILLRIVKRMASPPCLPVDLLIGMPRPHTAKRILFEATCLGVRRLHFFQSDRSEPSYMKSRLWQQGVYKDRLRLGAEQSFTTHIPEVLLSSSLREALSRINLETDSIAKLALDNYDAEHSLGRKLKNISSNKGLNISCVFLALGSERGWSSSEQALLINDLWELAHIGDRVLRLEMAVVSAIAITAEAMNLWNGSTSSTL